MHAGQDVGHSMMQHRLNLECLGNIIQNDTVCSIQYCKAAIASAAAVVFTQVLHNKNMGAGSLNPFDSKLVWLCPKSLSDDGPIGP